MNGYWVIRTYKAGGVVEKSKYFIKGERPTKRASKRFKTEIGKQEFNEVSTSKNLSRIINANFVPGDLFVTLTYSPSGLEKLTRNISEDDIEARYTAANKQMRLFFDRAKRTFEKAGNSFRYVGVTADYDPERACYARVHHHIIVPAAAIEIVKKKWTLGNVHIRKLEYQDDYTPIAEYMLYQVRHVANRKKYTPSRNLVRPEPRDRIAVNAAELRVPQGATLLYRSQTKQNNSQYLRYVFPDERQKQYEKAGIKTTPERAPRNCPTLGDLDNSNISDNKINRSGSVNIIQR